MTFGSMGGTRDELERLRRSYEDSISWRITRPLRGARRLVRAVQPVEPDREEQETSGLDSWLESVYGDELEELERRCAESHGGERWTLFRELDDDLWAMLLTQEYRAYPAIRALLPAVPEPALQEMWNGRSGLHLAAQSKGFYVKLREAFDRHGLRPLNEATVLDFGCGWGRLTRYLARDITPGRLFGCDPARGILDRCRGFGVPATLARSEFLPARLPFEATFDLIFAFSVFTHLSEEAHRRCLETLHGSLGPGGILAITIRPPAYAEVAEPLRALLEGSPEATLAGERYLFAPHADIPGHPQMGETGQMHYGETVLTLDYVRRHWTRLFELLDVQLSIEDPFQVFLVLRRREPEA
jgi:SAM-dependent methyltransferase